MPDVPVGELLNRMQPQFNAEQSRKKRYWVRHTREDSIHDPLLMQNRMIEAESAGQALRIAIDPFGDKSPLIVATTEYMVFATMRGSEGKTQDIWQAEAESLRYRAAI